MRLIAVLLGASLACTLVSSQDDLGAIFDALLAEDDIVLSGPFYRHRKNIFVVNYLSADHQVVPSLDLMFTDEEDEGRNGAKWAPPMADEELQKREDERLLSVRAPAVYDSRKVIRMNKPPNQLTCGNCYMHVFAAALEIAHTKLTGELIKLSEQELTDCYHRGCNGGDPRQVAIWMSYVDKLSTRAEYGPYNDGSYTCRAGTTPDALDKIKIKQFVHVSAATVAESVATYGSVITCMTWHGSCNLKYWGPGDPAVNFPEPPGKGGCDHAVLIVGYTADHYIVRNSHGKTWGEKGYFRVARGVNSCGIEDDMSALVVESRTGSKDLAANGCPPDKPDFCAGIHACVPAGQPCASPINRVVEVKREENEDENEEEGNPVEKREDDGTTKHGGGWSPVGMKVEKRSADEVVPLKKRLLEKRAEEIAEIIEMEKRCADTSKKCRKKMSKLCHLEATQVACPVTCNACSNAVEEETLPIETKEIVGNCYKPAIPNGKVANKGAMLEYGETLDVKCNRKAGYVAVGEPVTCLIQDVFTNADHDGRLLPECVQANPGEALVGNGETYTGTKSTYTDPGTGEEVTCDSWNKEIYEGSLLGNYGGGDLAIGNHNFCRNTGGHPVPLCMSGTPASLHYCFDYPGCEVCAGGGVDLTPSCGNVDCKYTTMKSRRTTDWEWANCAATCCALAGC